METTIVNNLSLPITGVLISLMVYMIGIGLSKASHGFFLFNPLFFGILLGIAIIYLWAKGIGRTPTYVYHKFYLPGADIITWFIKPATVAFAIPIYRVNYLVKKYWFDILVICFLGGFIEIFLIQHLCALLGISAVSTASLMPQAAATAVAMPISEGTGGISAITAMACIINSVIIYAGSTYLIKALRLDKISPIATGLALGSSGHTIGSVEALSLGEVQGAMAGVAVLVTSLSMDILIPLYMKIFM